MTAAVGLALNLILGIVKLVLGVMSGSVAIMGDAVNNLSDVGTSAVAVSAFVIAGKKADRNHPYGHGRFEYVAALFLSVVLIFVGFELLISSIKNIVSGSNSEFSLTVLIVLAVSIGVKLVQGIMYYSASKKLSSGTLKAAYTDSFSDCFVTFTVAVAFFVNTKTNLPVEAVCGILAAALIVFNGGKLIVQTVNKLMGTHPDESVVKSLLELVGTHPEILGMHDLAVHDYGAGNTQASVDVEFDSNTDFVTVHRIAHELESAARKQLNISLVVHPDPVFNANPAYTTVRHAIMRVLVPYGEEASFHELNVDDGAASIHLRLSARLMRERERVLAELMSAVDNVVPGMMLSAEYDFM